MSSNRKSNEALTHLLLATACAFTLSAAGCSSSEPSDVNSREANAKNPNSGEADAGSDDDGGPSEGADNALYAVTTTVFDDTSAATYVVFLDSLDSQQVDLSSAPEFAGWSSVTAHGGALFVGHGERPEVARYDVRSDGSLADSARTVSFSAYGVSSGSLSFNTFVDETMAHLSLEQTSRILWDPAKMEIRKSVDTEDIVSERDGMTVGAANYLGRVVREQNVFQPFFWHDADWYEFHQQSQLGIYSRDGQLDTLLDAPCPALQIATADEEGNLYFSGMVDTIAYQLIEPESTLERCVVRVNAGEKSIAAGWPRQFDELTEGRPAGVFYYLEDGIGILSVYHVEHADPTSASFIDTWYTENWGLWLVNLEDWTAEPITEWELGPSNIFFSKVDGRLFVHKVASDFSETIIYEVTVGGSVTERMTVPGYAAYELERVR